MSKDRLTKPKTTDFYVYIEPMSRAHYMSDSTPLGPREPVCRTVDKDTVQRVADALGMEFGEAQGFAMGPYRFGVCSADTLDVATRLLWDHKIETLKKSPSVPFRPGGIERAKVRAWKLADDLAKRPIGVVANADTAPAPINWPTKVASSKLGSNLQFLRICNEFILI